MDSIVIVGGIVLLALPARIYTADAEFVAAIKLLIQSEWR